MLRLPRFSLHQPATVAEAVELRAAAQGEASWVAGGTDLFPNMKRRQQTPATVISLARIAELRGITQAADGGLHIGACVTLSELAGSALVRSLYPSVASAAELVSTPLLRNMGTIGGNLLLDTRCNYYNQGFELRRAINFCMKREGDICWVAPSSKRCWAVQSSDGAPVAVALGASVSLAGKNGTRTIPASALYLNDGMRFLSLQPDELLTGYHLPAPNGWRASYQKLRRRGSFDFPVLGVCAWLQFANDGTVADARIVLGAIASHPMVVEDAADALRGRMLNAESIADAADAAFRPAKPMDNTDFTLSWRKEMVRVYTQRALEQLASSPPRAKP
jgi:4-hydroxybenzoyl-CoA reductase subunit beta